jgi:hypothetical protein
MALTRAFKVTILAQVHGDPRFRIVLLKVMGRSHCGTVVLCKATPRVIGPLCINRKPER